MKKNQSVKIFLMLVLSIFTLFIINNHKVKADMGPKPYIEINIKNINCDEYYVTLLSKTERYGPWKRVKEEDLAEYIAQLEDPSIWQKFYDYVDSDNFYFLNHYQKLSQEDVFRWGYMPPGTFKMLIYIPNTDKFIVSEIYERYAFSSIFTFVLSKVEGANGDINLVQTPVKIVKQNIFFMELFKFILRVVATLGIELLIALLFFYKIKKREIKVIAIVNVITQLILNISLSIWIYYNSLWIFEIILFIIIEIFIIIIEGLAYAYFLKEEIKERGKPWLPYLYAIVANVLSLVIGYGLALLTTYLF